MNECFVSIFSMMFPPCSGACPPRPKLGPPHQRRRQPPAARPHLRQPQLRRRGGGHLQARVPGDVSSYTVYRVLYIGPLSDHIGCFTC